MGDLCIALFIFPKQLHMQDIYSLGGLDNE